MTTTIRVLRSNKRKPSVERSVSPLLSAAVTKKQKKSIDPSSPPSSATTEALKELKTKELKTPKALEAPKTPKTRKGSRTIVKDSVKGLVKGSVKDSVKDSEKNSEKDSEIDNKPNLWLLKAEPETRMVNGHDVKFSIDDLEKEGPSHWDGVRNHEAKNNMCKMKVNDYAFFYHSNCKVPGIVGIMRISKAAYVDCKCLSLCALCICLNALKTSLRVCYHYSLTFFFFSFGSSHGV